MNLSEFASLALAIILSVFSGVLFYYEDFALNKSTLGGLWMAFLFWMAYLKMRQLRIREDHSRK